MACIRDDPEFLSLADIWASRARAAMDNESAFYNTEMELTPDAIGRNAIVHTASGVYVAQALVSYALGDTGTQSEALQGFAESAGVATENLDLVLGKAGALLGTAALHEAMPAEGLRSFGQHVFEELWSELASSPSVAETKVKLNLGIAHGWAGVLYATLRWCRTTGADLPPAVPERLEQLAEFAEDAGRGVRWKWVDSLQGPPQSGGYMYGWCSGSAGYVFLWTLAHEVFGEAAWGVSWLSARRGMRGKAATDRPTSAVARPALRTRF